MKRIDDKNKIYIFEKFNIKLSKNSKKNNKNKLENKTKFLNISDNKKNEKKKNEFSNWNLNYKIFNKNKLNILNENNIYNKEKEINCNFFLKKSNKKKNFFNTNIFRNSNWISIKEFNNYKKDLDYFKLYILDNKKSFNKKSNLQNFYIYNDNYKQILEENSKENLTSFQSNNSRIPNNFDKNFKKFNSDEFDEWLKIN